jgi:threonyl-tRNA synthetase
MSSPQDSEYLDHLRHSAAHLLAAAVLDLYPGTKNTIGPAIDNGFYYDFEFTDPINEQDLPKIEARMQELVKGWVKFDRQEVSSDEAKELFKDNPYKLELIEEFSKEDQTLTTYTSGNFTDLCRGGHLENPSKELKAFKLLSIAGAYWRGDEKNKMLTRVYGTAFSSQEELDNYLTQQEEAKKRDHRKLGQELDLFTFSELVGAGLPLFTPKGTFIRQALFNRLVEISEEYGYQQVTIPHIAKIALYETSGHAQKFSDELFRVISHYKEEFVMKPVNCPHHTQIYASRPRSYKDLPLRYMESTTQYRDEKPGEIGGLTRTRAFMVDDGHLFCRIDQVKEEAKNLCLIIEQFYKSLGMWGKHWISLSVRDPKDLSKYIGDEDGWDKAEKMLAEISEELKLDAKRMEGEAAIYGPKLDYMFTDSLGRERQLATVQIDFAMPKRFNLTYQDNDGSMQTPVMIHRAILGSYERFLAILIEHFGGAFPVWLSPLQVKIIPISERHNDYAQKVLEGLKSSKIRVEVDDRAETMQSKIRDAQMQKVPYMLILGDREIESQTASVRSRDEGDLGALKIEEFTTKIKSQLESRA